MAEGTPIGALAVRIGADATDLIEGFGKAGKATERLASTLKLAAGAALAAEAALAAMVLTTAKVQDEAGKMAQRVGIAVESFSALAYAGRLADVSNENLATGLKQLSKNMAEAQAGSGDAAEAFRALNLQITSSSGSLLLTDEVFAEIAAKFAGMEDGANKTALAMKLFGKSGADLIPLLNQGRQGLEEARKEAERFGLIISAEAAKAAEEFNDNLTRLRAASEGVAMYFATPFVEALGKAAGAMLDAKKAGEGLFQQLSQGIFTLFTGDDAHKLNVRIFEAAEAATNAQAKLNNALQQQRDAGGLGASVFDDQQVARYKQEVREAEAALASLLQMQRAVTPEEKPKAPKEKGPALPGSSKDAERDARQIQQGVEEEERIQREAVEATVKYRDQQLAKEREFIENRNKALIEMFEREEAMAIEHGQRIIAADGLAHSAKLEALRVSLLTEEEREIEAHAKKMERLAEFSAEELEALGGFQKIKEQMEQEHQERLRQIQSRAITTRNQFEKAGMMQQAKTIFGELANITAGVAQHNRTLFELNKVAGIANAIINAYEGISRTLATYPYPINIAMAAAHGIAAFAQVSAIRSASFGGGGGTAPSLAGGTPAAAVTPVTSGAPGGAGAAGPQRIFNIHVNGSSRAVFEELAHRMNELADEGFVFRLA